MRCAPCLKAGSMALLSGRAYVSKSVDTVDFALLPSPATTHLLGLKRLDKFSIDHNAYA